MIYALRVHPPLPISYEDCKRRKYPKNAIIPTKLRLRKMGGVRRVYRDTILQNYIFFKEPVYKGILLEGEDLQLIETIFKYCDEDYIVPQSDIEIIGSDVRLVNGILQEFDTHISRTTAHYRVVIISKVFLGDPVDLFFGLRIVKKEGDEYVSIDNA